MSKLFGLEWKEYPAERMRALMTIDSLIQQIKAERSKEKT